MGFSAYHLVSLYALYESPDLMQEWKRAEAQLLEEYICSHDEIETRWQIQGSNGKRFRRQCVRCGYLIGHVPKDEVLYPDLCHPVDTDLRRAWSHERTVRQERLRAEYQERARSANIVLEYQIWAEYNSYINSAEWRVKRDLVLKRDNYVCQGCLQSKAVHVHHLTYVHLGCELLFELVSVCRKCHERIHADRVYDQDTVVQTIDDLF